MEIHEDENKEENLSIAENDDGGALPVLSHLENFVI